MNIILNLEGLTALIVEDQPLIAMDLEQILEDMGVNVVATLASTREAIDFLEQYSPHIAILDVDLGEETSEPIARLLLERKMPFLFATGYDDKGIIAADLAAAPVVHKPFDRRAILDSLRAALS